MGYSVAATRLDPGVLHWGLDTAPDTLAMCSAPMTRAFKIGWPV